MPWSKALIYRVAIPPNFISGRPAGGAVLLHHPDFMEAFYTGALRLFPCQEEPVSWH